MEVYFEKTTTLDEAKKKFRELSKELHPDKPGGDSAKFVEMKRQYGQLLQATKEHCESAYDKKPNSKLRNVLNEIKNELRDTGVVVGRKILQSDVMQNHLRNTASKSKSPFEKILNIGIANFLDQFK